MAESNRVSKRNPQNKQNFPKEELYGLSSQR